MRHLDLHLDGSKRPAERLAALLKGVEDRYDVAFLDCPPSISLASESVFGAADALLVPVIPTTLSSRTLHQLSNFLGGQESPPALLPYFSMVDGRKRLHRDVMVAIRAEWPHLLTTAIPNASTIERMGPERAPVGAYAPSSLAAQAFGQLWSEVASRLWREVFALVSHPVQPPVHLTTPPPRRFGPYGPYRFPSPSRVHCLCRVDQDAGTLPGVLRGLRPGQAAASE